MRNVTVSPEAVTLERPLPMRPSTNEPSAY